jgi:hypothetical protein
MCRADTPIVSTGPHQAMAGIQAWARYSRVYALLVNPDKQNGGRGKILGIIQVSLLMSVYLLHHPHFSLELPKNYWNSGS